MANELVKKPWSENLAAMFGWTRMVNPLPPNVEGSENDNPYAQWLMDELRLSQGRAQRYNDYDKMDRDAEVAAVIDTYAEEAFLFNEERGATVWIDADNDHIQKILSDFLRRIQIEDRGLEIIRRMCKYGDEFQKNFYLESGESRGINKTKFQDASSVSRIEDDMGILVGWDTAELHGEDKPALRPWDMLHWRLLLGRRSGDDRYGDSIIEDAREIWKRIRLHENAVTMYRIQNAPDRFVFYVDTQLSAPEHQFQVMNWWRRKLRKNNMFNPKSSDGDQSQSLNPWTSDDFLVWPLKENSQSRVEKIPGSSNMDDLADLEYYRNKLYSAFRVPQGFLGGSTDGGGLNPHLMISEQNLRFARRAKRIQRAFILTLSQACKIHYKFVTGKVLEFPKHFRIGMSIIAVEDQMRRLEIAQAKLDTSQRLSDLASTMDLNSDALKVFILRTLLGLNTDEILILTKAGPSTKQDMSGMDGTPPDDKDSFDDQPAGDQPAGAHPSDTQPNTVGTQDKESIEEMSKVFSSFKSGLVNNPEFRKNMDDIWNTIQESDAFKDQDIGIPFEDA